MTSFGLGIKKMSYSLIFIKNKTGIFVLTGRKLDSFQTPKNGYKSFYYLEFACASDVVLADRHVDG